MLSLGRAFERGDESTDGFSSFLDRPVHLRILVLDAEKFGLDTRAADFSQPTAIR